MTNFTGVSARTPATGRELLKVSLHQMKAVPGVVALAVLGPLAAAVLFLGLAAPGLAIAVGLTSGLSILLVLALTLVVGGIAAAVLLVVFQGAVTSVALRQSIGEHASVRQGFSDSFRSFGRLFQWSLVNATVGVVMGLISDRAGALGDIVSALGGLAWKIASYFALPVILVEKTGPFDALKRSSQLLRTTWGSAARTTVRFGLILLPFALAGIALLALGWHFITNDSDALGATLFALGVVVLVMMAGFVSTVTAYAQVLLYRFATGVTPKGVSPEVLQGAFRAK
ncbi:DUF6159 family protein [Microbacterium sp. NPDC076911]|uniref:DUF6159 family protein n=1 Tax=Microbacterium sp. NPDC076911 TaxID=3154958 RepID=UPI003432E3DE